MTVLRKEFEMKKWMMALLCALLAAMLPMTALAAPGDVVVACGEGRAIEEGIRSFCVVGDTMYMIPYEADVLYAHTVGDAEPKAYSLEMEKPENGDNNSLLLSDGERLMLLNLQYTYDKDRESVSAALYELALDGDSVTQTPMAEPDWSFLQSEDGEYYRYPEKLLALKDCVLISSYDDYGDNMLYRLDYTDGSARPLDVENAYAMSPYTDGRALIELFDYNQSDKVQFVVYDPTTDGVETLGEVAIENYVTFDCLTCDEQSGQVYFVRSGEIFPLDVTTGAVGGAVADMPVDTYTQTGARVTASGYFALAGYDAYMLRNLHPDSAPAVRMKVQDWIWADGVNDAYYDFINAHGEVSMVVSHDGSAESVIESMMNRDSSVDVYIMSSSDPNYEAVRSRGYMAGMTQNETLATLAQRMDPGLLEQFSANGEFSALPVQIYFWLPRINETALSKVGLTMDDIPRNWSDFLDFLLEIQDRWPQDGSVTLLDPWTSWQSARNALFDQIFSAYQTALSVNGDAVDSRTMTEILQKLEKIDFARFGQPDESVFENGDYDVEYDESRIVLTTGTGTQISGITSDSTPIAMALTPELPAYVPMETSVAFVNPYSEHIDLALEFIAMLSERISESVTYCLCPDLDQPTPNPYYEESVQYAEENLATVQKALDEAEEVDRQMMEMQLESAKENLERCKGMKFSISSEDIAWLQTNRENLIVEGSNWLYSGDDGDAWELVQQYVYGQIDAERLMKEIDRKIRMMMMEGY